MDIPTREAPRLAYAAALAAMLCTGANAGTPQALATAQMAASCANCHGTGGHAAGGSALPSLAGMPQAKIVESLKAFKSGARAATIMHQLSKGYTDAQLEQVAAYFAAQKP